MMQNLCIQNRNNSALVACFCMQNLCMTLACVIFHLCCGSYLPVSKSLVMAEAMGSKDGPE